MDVLKRATNEPRCQFVPVVTHSIAMPLQPLWKSPEICKTVTPPTLRSKITLCVAFFLIHQDFRIAKLSQSLEIGLYVHDIILMWSIWAQRETLLHVCTGTHNLEANQEVEQRFICNDFHLNE